MSNILDKAPKRRLKINNLDVKSSSIVIELTRHYLNRNDVLDEVTYKARSYGLSFDYHDPKLKCVADAFVEIINNHTFKVFEELNKAFTALGIEVHIHDGYY